jgi:hypothetical protein
MNFPCWTWWKSDNYLLVFHKNILTQNCQKKYAKQIPVLYFSKINMNPQQEKMLRELYYLTLENNQMLNSINSQRRFANFIWGIKWIIIIGILIGTYQTLLPYFSTFEQILESFQKVNQMA